MATIRAGQRADADRVHGMIEQQLFTPRIFSSTGIGTGGTSEGAFRVMNTWVSGWMRIIFGTSPDFEGVLFPPLPISTEHMVPTSHADLVTQVPPIGWGMYQDDSSGGNTRVVSVVARRFRQIVLMALRYDGGGVTDTAPFTVASGDSVIINFAYPAAGYELAGRLE